jgi:hypothetical protein
MSTQIVCYCGLDGINYLATLDSETDATFRQKVNGEPGFF